MLFHRQRYTLYVIRNTFYVLRIGHIKFFIRPDSIAVRAGSRSST